MKSLLSSKPGPAYEAQRTEPMETTGMDDAHRTPAAPGPLTSFARFVLCGGGIGLASSPAVTLLAALMPWAVANALITVASTLLCTELHARFTFAAGQRAGWRQHLQSAGSASAAYAVTCAAMLILQTVQPSAGILSEQAVYLSAAGLAGLGRFLLLRLFVFTAGRNHTTTPPNSPARTQQTSATVSSPIPAPTQPKNTPSARRLTGNTSPRRPNTPISGITYRARAARAATTVSTVRASSRWYRTVAPAPGKQQTSTSAITCKQGMPHAREQHNIRTQEAPAQSSGYHFMKHPRSQTEPRQRQHGIGLRHIDNTPETRRNTPDPLFATAA